MIYLIYYVGIASILHFVYEGILAPSFRLRLRFKLFALRDEVRSLKIEHGDELDNKHFQYLHESINLIIGYLGRMDFWTFAKADHAIRHNPELKKEVEDRLKILDDCPFEKARELRRRTVKIFGEAVMVNTGALLIYFIPVSVVAFISVKSLSAVRSWLSRKIRSMTAFPGSEMERFADRGGMTEIPA